MSESDPLLDTIQDNIGYMLLMQAVLSHHLEVVSWLASIDPDCIKNITKTNKMYKLSSEKLSLIS